MDGEYRIYFTWQEMGDSLKLAYLPFSQTRQINYIFTINRPIVVDINILFIRGIYMSIILKLYACKLIWMLLCRAEKKGEYNKLHFKINIRKVCFHISRHACLAYFIPWLIVASRQVPRYNWNIVESGVKHHNPYLRVK